MQKEGGEKIGSGQDIVIRPPSWQRTPYNILKVRGIKTVPQHRIATLMFCRRVMTERVIGDSGNPVLTKTLAAKYALHCAGQRLLSKPNNKVVARGRKFTHRPGR